MFTRNRQAVIEKQWPDVSIEMIKRSIIGMPANVYPTENVLFNTLSSMETTLNCNGSPSGGLHILQTNAKLQNVISLAWIFQTWWPAKVLMRVLWGSWLPTSLQLASVEVTSDVAHSHNTRQETRESTRRINNATITSVTPHVPRRCVQITGTSFGQPRVWGSNLFYLFN